MLFSLATCARFIPSMVLLDDGHSCKVRTEEGCRPMASIKEHQVRFLTVNCDKSEVDNTSKGSKNKKKAKDICRDYNQA